MTTVAAAAPPMMKKCYSREDLEIFNLLDHPVWVFDIVNKAMWWANTAALELWNAPSLEALLARSFRDMSEATSRRLADYLERFHKGHCNIRDQWTYYPAGKGPTTVYVTENGIYTENNQLMMLNEGVLQRKEEVDQKSLRGVEMLRHLPVAVSQFSIDGAIQSQNPEAMDLYGSCCASGGEADSHNSFLSHFVDQTLAQHVLTEVQNGKDQCVEAQQQTRRGMKWSSIKVRKAKDPVTTEPVILYSARDITEVIEAKNEAHRANIAKSEFLAVMSHEIRTPLHQVVGFVELLEQTTLTEEQSELCRLLQNSVTSLMTVINDLLDYSKLEAGKMNLEIIDFDCRDVVEGCMAVVGPLAENKGLKLDSSWCDMVPLRIMGDPNRLRQVLLNLLQNAVKFTKQGQVGLQVSLNNDNLEFTVTDTGIGISPDHAKQIFKKYHQADASISRHYGGTGLGLAICKCLVELMGGNISVKSKEGQGSDFSFTIPLCLPSHSKQRPKSEIPVTFHNKYNILVVEDNNVNQKLMKAMLKRIGHVVTTVSNGKEALEEVNKDYDLVLMDIEMPIMDGISATKAIRQQLTEKELPIVGLTASFRNADKEFYCSIGMNDCIGKPVRLEDLRTSIDGIFVNPKRKKARIEKRSSCHF